MFNLRSLLCLLSLAFVLSLTARAQDNQSAPVKLGSTLVNVPVIVSDRQGRFYRREVTDLKQTFDLIADELRHQYRLGFYANDDKPDGSLHRLRVQVARPDAVVRARHSYRAAQSD